MKLKVGTRGSKLALKQVEIVLEQLKKIDSSLEFDIVKIKTTGDKIRDVPLAKIGGKGLFVKEIDKAVLDGKVDFAVHSLKDIPYEMTKGLELIAIPKREDPVDVLISRDGKKLRELPKGSIIGTSSIRRKAMILNFRNDLIVKDLRGNVDTRLRKLFSGMYDAIILAKAGIKRMGFERYITEELNPEVFPHAIGQGAIAVVCRRDFEHKEILRGIDDYKTRCVTLAEREISKTIKASCQIPIGVCSKIRGSLFELRAFLFSLDGKIKLEAKAEGKLEDYLNIGRYVGELLLEKMKEKNLIF